jgi:hypothetical protein
MLCRRSATAPAFAPRGDEAPVDGERCRCSSCATDARTERSSSSDLWLMAKKVLAGSLSVAVLGGLTALVLAAPTPARQHAAVPMQASGTVKAAAIPQIAPAPTRETTARVV